jgi:hypothetical protein
VRRLAAALLFPTPIVPIVRRSKLRRTRRELFDLAQGRQAPALHAPFSMREASRLK